jgi:hypothetical protein
MLRRLLARVDLHPFVQELAPALGLLFVAPRSLLIRLPDGVDFQSAIDYHVIGGQPPAVFRLCL